jgi:hypothetical protein
MKLNKEAEEILINIAADKGLYVEGNILKVIESDNEKFSSYLSTAIEKDKETRRKRLEITKQIQEQNVELKKSQDKNKILMEDLQSALKTTEDAKKSIESDLEILQKKKQFELIDIIVRTALFLIVSVGIVTTILFIFTIIKGTETQLVGHAWTSMFSILLTNSFSIIGTIMGVKYASNKNNE